MTEPIIAITGGAGFLGEHLVPSIVERGYRVRVLDMSPPPEWSDASLEYIRGDVCDAGAVERAVRGASSVIHLAFAPPHASRLELYRVNVAGTRAVIAAAARAGADGVVAVSSTIVTRPTRRHPVLRRAPLSRLDDYRATRMEAERILATPSAAMAVATVRPKTFVGPGRVGGFGLVFALVQDGAAVPILGSGRNRYQLLDIRDFADGMVLLAERPRTGLFHFGASAFGTVADDLGAVVDHAATGARIRTIPPVLGRAALRAVELAGLAPLAEWHHCVARGEDSVVDISVAQQHLGWEPRWSNSASLIDAFDWFASEQARTGRARTTHPVPASHRLLRRVAGSVLR